MKAPPIISLDYDGTASLDLETFIEVAQKFINAGFDVYVVTMRFTNEPVPKILSDALQVIYTGRLAKKQFMIDIGLPVTIWIEDSPHYVLMDAYAEDSDDLHGPANKFHNPQFDEFRTKRNQILLSA